MVLAIVNSIDFTFRLYKNTKMAMWHIATHFVVEGHKYERECHIARYVRRTCDGTCSGGLNNVEVLR